MSAAADSDNEFVDNDAGGDDSGTGELTGISTCDLGDCKILQQPVPIEATHCRKGVFVMLKDNPCKISDLKISKTGKHGHAKANMVGYDIVSGRKYQETVPGHTSMLEFTPIKVDYEVADISGSDITAMDADGEEFHFTLPGNEIGEKLKAEFKKNAEQKGDAFYNITVLYAPRLKGKKWEANMMVESYKLGKE